ncbi:universal stress protein [Streptosporangium sp. NPDC000396]|uniref:universal stress protein n=1 Tax=Streptosporangium sp. NPDC000396 TaxID=3366185 RepID=UPI0036D18182
MKIEHVLVGFIPEPRGKDALTLAATAARQAGARLTVAYVHVPAWTTPGPGKIDAEWQAYVLEQSDRALNQARRLLADVQDVPIDYVTSGNRGSGRGLAQLAVKAKADVVVIGSAPGGGRGRISLGSTADQLLHASPVPVVLVPKGYADEHPFRIQQLIVTYRRDPASDDAVKQSAALAAQTGVPLRLITLVVSGGRGAKMAEEMLDRLREKVAADLEVAARGHGRVQVEMEVLEGKDVARALGGADCEGALLICASSETGPLRRVFLGDTSLKIIRSASCPVMMLPRNPAKKP